MVHKVKVRNVADEAASVDMEKKCFAGVRKALSNGRTGFEAGNGFTLGKA